jgi:ribosomal protein L6P/L9E
MVIGVTEGFTKSLDWWGYRASNQGQKIRFSSGYSHNIVF